MKETEYLDGDNWHNADKHNMQQVYNRKQYVHAGRSWQYLDVCNNDFTHFSNSTQFFNIVGCK